MNVDVVPKWAREARDHILDLSVKLDSADDYIRKLEAAMGDIVLSSDANDGDSLMNAIQAARAVIASAEGEAS
jgi:hypothetical protein